MIGKANSHRAIVHALGGIEDHIHLVVSIPPTISIADFVKHIKGSSAHHINCGPRRFGLMFRWQRGYGVFSLGAKQLPAAVAYARNQKVHHRSGTLIEALEEISWDEDGAMLNTQSA